MQIHSLYKDLWKLILWTLFYFSGNLSGPTGLISAQGGKYIVRKNMLLCVPDFDPMTNKEEPNYQPVNFCQTPYQRLDFISSLESATGVKFPDSLDLTRDDSVQFLQDLCRKHVSQDYQPQG